MKVITIPIYRGTLQIVLSGQFRRKFKYLSLGLCGKRKRRRIQTELEQRITQEVLVKWRWFPFIDFLTIRDGQRYFNIFGNDPWPLKCYVEYEFWKYKHTYFHADPFVTYMKEKYGKTEDEVLEGCLAVMLNVYESDKDFLKNADDGSSKR